MSTTNCKHDNTTELLVVFRVKLFRGDHRHYEVAMCLDCGRLINYETMDENRSVMPPTEVTQMFKDMRDQYSDLSEAAQNVSSDIAEANEMFKELSA